MDYSPTMPLTNCCLINLEDMLQNGTVISGVKIEKPHSFKTACTIATQVITQVSSSQFGGNSFTLSHLAPFVDISRQKIREQVEKEAMNILASVGESIDITTDLDSIVKQRVREEIRDGVQTIQYQLITMSSTNG